MKVDSSAQRIATCYEAAFVNYEWRESGPEHCFLSQEKLSICLTILLVCEHCGVNHANDPRNIRNVVGEKSTLPLIIFLWLLICLFRIVHFDSYLSCGWASSKSSHSFFIWRNRELLYSQFKQRELLLGSDLKEKTKILIGFVSCS